MDLDAARQANSNATTAISQCRVTTEVLLIDNQQTSEVYALQNDKLCFYGPKNSEIWS